MLFVKNLPTWERLVRIAGALAIAVAVPFLAAPWTYVAGLSAATFALTAFVGYCPMCAMVGRRRRT